MIFTKEHLEQRASDRPAGYREAVAARSKDLGNGCYQIDAAALRELWAIYGAEAFRRLWGELHRTALTGPLGDKFLEQFGSRIPCGDCRNHWKEWVAAHPPAGDLFAWTVDGHNAVNARLGRPLFHVEEARARWAPPAVDTGPK